MFLKKAISYSSYFIGFTYLSLFLTNLFFLEFIVQATDRCRFTDALLPYVTCGSGFFDSAAEIYANFSSLLVVGFAVISVMGLFTLHFAPFIICFSLGLIIISCFRVLLLVFKKIIEIRRVKKTPLYIILITILFFTPISLTFLLKLYLVPPQNSNRIVSVDFWHGGFSVPRNLLSDWSLTDAKRPEKEVRYSPDHVKRWKKSPYIIFHAPDTASGILEVLVTPRYHSATEDALYAERAEYLNSKITKKTWPSSNVYQDKTFLDQWEIHKPSKARSYIPEIYVWWDDEGRIKHVLECTPENMRSVDFHRYRQDVACIEKSDCDGATRICSVRTSGSHDYNIFYSFDKGRIKDFYKMDADIKEFVGSFYSKKSD